MKSSTKRTACVSLTLLLSILMINYSFQSMATTYPYEVNASEAQSGIGYWGGASRYTDGGAIKITDAHTTLLYAGSSAVWIASGDFTGHNPWQWPTLPDMPNNATVLHVDLIVVLKYPYTYSSTWFNLQYALNTTYDEVWTDTASWYGPGNATWVDGPITYWKTCTVNVTDETVGGPTGGWSASMINSNQTWVRIYTSAYLPYERAIEIDYIGLNYVWQYSTGGAPPDGGTSGGTFWMSDLFMEVLAGVSFLAVIAYPALAIYSYKSTDEKLSSFSGFIIGEVIFIGLLWFALSALSGKI